MPFCMRVSLELESTDNSSASLEAITSHCGSMDSTNSLADAAAVADAYLAGVGPGYVGDEKGGSECQMTAIDDNKAPPMTEEALLASTGTSVLPRSTIRSVFLVLSCAGAMIINVANATAVAVALPRIGKDLHIREDKLQWVVSAYSLSAGCLLLLFGRLADLYGRKNTFLIGACWLAVFAIGCAFAKDAITLNVLRALQGVGGAAMIPAAIGILARAFPPSQARSTAFATFGAGAPIGSVFGLTIGAMLVQLTAQTWKSVFYMSAGISVIVFVGGLTSIDRDEVSTEVDWIGSLLITAALVLIIFVLSDGSMAPYGWATHYIIGCLAAGAVLIALFFVWQGYLGRAQDRGSTSVWTPPPLVRNEIWFRANGRFAGMQLIVFLTWCSFLSNNFWVQLFYQNHLRLSPVLTMVRLLPSFVTGVVCNVLIAVLVGRVRLVFLIIFGTLMTACGNIFFALVKDGQSYWSYGFPGAIVVVVGADFVFSSGTIFIAKCALPHEQSVAGALFTVMTQLGTSFGLAITTILYNRVVYQGAVKGTGPVPAAQYVQLEAYHKAEWGGFGFGVAAALIAGATLYKTGVVGTLSH